MPCWFVSTLRARLWGTNEPLDTPRKQYLIDVIHSIWEEVLGKFICRLFSCFCHLNIRGTLKQRPPLTLGAACSTDLHSIWMQLPLISRTKEQDVWTSGSPRPDWRSPTEWFSYERMFMVTGYAVPPMNTRPASQVTEGPCISLLHFLFACVKCVYVLQAWGMQFSLNFR